MLTRQLGSILRGRATRLQVMLASVLGGLLGFVPGFFLPGDLAGGFGQAPGLIVLLLCVALIANANLAVFSLAVLLAKLLSLPLLSLSFTLGTWLVDGPLQGLFRWLCNTQVSAWFGLEHYATTGGLVLGLAFGIGMGWITNRALRAVRGHMANVERSSERYQKLSSKWWIRLLTWMFLGSGKGKKTWQEVSEHKGLGMPIRILGVVAAVLLCGGLFTFQQWFSTPLLTAGLQTSLAAGNGATVDLERASLHLGAGEIRVTGLALADRGDLGKDMLAADELVFKVDMAELLRRRFVIDEVRAVNARSGTRRSTPGILLPGTEPAPEPTPAPAGVPTIEDYLEDFELWQQRLEQAREWVEVLFADEGGEVASLPQTEAEIVDDRQRQIDTVGLAGVVARHLFGAGPRVLIRKIDIEGITWTHDGVEEALALRLRNISSDPSLVEAASSVALVSASENFALGFAGAEAGAGAGLTLRCRGIAVDRLFAGLRLSAENPLRGGTFDFDCEGALDWSGSKAMTMDLPIAITLRDTTFAVPGAGEARLDQLVLPFGLGGAVTRPVVRLETKALREALLAAGKQQLAQFVQQHVGAALGELSSKLPGALEGIVDPTKPPGEIVDAAKARLQQEADKAKAELEGKAKKELEKVLPGLGGLLGGKKKKKD